MALSHPPLRFILAAAFGGIALLAALATSLLAGNAASRRVEANQFAMLDTAACPLRRTAGQRHGGALARRADRHPPADDARPGYRAGGPPRHPAPPARYLCRVCPARLRRTGRACGGGQPAAAGRPGRLRPALPARRHARPGGRGRARGADAGQPAGRHDAAPPGRPRGAGAGGGWQPGRRDRRASGLALGGGGGRHAAAGGAGDPHPLAQRARCCWGPRALLGRQLDTAAIRRAPVAFPDGGRLPRRGPADPGLAGLSRARLAGAGAPPGRRWPWRRRRRCSATSCSMASPPPPSPPCSAGSPPPGWPCRCTGWPRPRRGSSGRAAATRCPPAAASPRR